MPTGTKEAMRALKRRISDAVYTRLQADAARRTKAGPGRAIRDDSRIQRDRLNPETGSSEQPLPNPTTRYGPTSPPRHGHNHTRPKHVIEQRTWHKQASIREQQTSTAVSA